MGKIVRGAKILANAYVVAVPDIEPEERPRGAGELDDRFAGTGDNDNLAFDQEQHDMFVDGDEDELLGAPPLAAPPPQIDYERIAADARALIDNAEADAEALLQHAAQRAQELVDRANARLAELEAQARTRGHEEGLAAGRAAANAEMSESVAAMHELVESARAQRHAVIDTAEPELVALAMAIAERIVHEQVAVSPSVVVENVRHALTRLIGREVVTLRVNPADLETIRQHRDAIAGSSDVEHLRVVEDQRVDRGGVVVETEAGTIDAKVSTQLREARRALQNGDTIGVAPTNGQQPALPAQAS